MNLFHNFGLLRDEMLKEEIAVTAFSFAYNHHQYYVVVGLLTEYENTSKLYQYAIVHLQFVDANNVKRYFELYANRAHLLFLKQNEFDFRRFLKVKYQEGFHDWLKSFESYFANFLPQSVPSTTSSSEREIIDRAESSFSGIDSNRIYPISVKRNGKKQNGEQKFRTTYNASLAKKRCPNLYRHFAMYKEISFCFSANPEDEKSEEEIIANFAKNEKR